MLVKHNGFEVQCYGDLEDDSNFEVVCEDESEDSTWAEGNPITDEPFKTWEEAIEVLHKYYDSNILELTAV